MNWTTIIKKPVATEKAMAEMKKNRFTLMVDRRATKGQVKQAIEQGLGVEVIKVNTLVIAGNRKFVGKKKARFVGKTGKKAVVEIKQGQTISALAGPSETKEKEEEVKK